MKLCPKLTGPQLEELSTRLNITQDFLEARKIQAILLLDQKADIFLISSITQLKRSRVFGLRSLYQKLGMKAVETKPRKVKLLLTKKQLKELERTLKEKTPDQLGYEGEKFWRTNILADYVKKIYTVNYKSKTSYYLIFKRVKFTYHKPGRVYERRDEAEVLRWRKEATPILQSVWNDPETVILCEDEMVLSTQTTVQKVWLTEGEYPEIKVSNTRKNKSIYGFLNLKTGKEHSFLASWQNMHVTKRILQQIRRVYPKNDNTGNKVKGKRILLLWDNPGWHRGSEVTDYIKKDGKIQVIFFPKYTPEENPQEHVWKEGRNRVTHNQFIPDLEKTAGDFVTYLNNTNFNYSLLGFSPIYKC